MMILGISIFVGVFWFLYIALILYAKQTPEAQVRRRLNLMIQRAEESRALLSDQQKQKQKHDNKQDSFNYFLNLFFYRMVMISL